MFCMHRLSSKRVTEIVKCCNDRFNLNSCFNSLGVYSEGGGMVLHIGLLTNTLIGLQEGDRGYYLEVEITPVQDDMLDVHYSISAVDSERSKGKDTSVKGSTIQEFLSMLFTKAEDMYINDLSEGFNVYQQNKEDTKWVGSSTLTFLEYLIEENGIKGYHIILDGTELELRDIGSYSKCIFRYKEGQVTELLYGYKNESPLVSTFKYSYETNLLFVKNMVDRVVKPKTT